MRKLVIGSLVLLVLAAVGGSAHAQGRYPQEYAVRPLQVPQGMVQLKVPLVINLSRDSDGKPIFIPFDIRIGASNDLELRLFHPVHGICLTGCGKVYNDLGFGLLYSLVRQRGVELSLLGALEITSFSRPANVRLDAGLGFKVVHWPISFAVWPYVGIGLNHRNENGDSINIPMELAIQISHPTALFIETGYYASTDDPGDGSGPIGVGLNYLASHGVDLGAEFKLNQILGHTDTGSRLILVYIAIRNQ